MDTIICTKSDIFGADRQMFETTGLITIYRRSDLPLEISLNCTIWEVFDSELLKPNEESLVIIERSTTNRIVYVIRGIEPDVHAFAQAINIGIDIFKIHKRS